jgi:hypothetical protein
MAVASSPHDFKLLMQADGRLGTTMEDVAVAEGHRQDSEADAGKQPPASRPPGSQPPVTVG